MNALLQWFGLAPIEPSIVCWRNWIAAPADISPVCHTGGSIFWGHVYISLPYAFGAFLLGMYLLTHPNNTKYGEWGGGILFMSVVALFLGGPFHFFLSAILRTVLLSTLVIGSLIGIGWSVHLLHKLPKLSPAKLMQRRIDRKQTELAEIEAKLVEARRQLPEYRQFDDSLKSTPDTEPVVDDMESVPTARTRIINKYE